MSCYPLCNPDLPLGSIHLDPSADPSPGKIVQEPSILPLEVALVLPMPTLADECLRPQLLLQIMLLLCGILLLRSASDTSRLGDWHNKHGDLHLASDGLPAVPHNQDYLQQVPVLCQVKEYNQRDDPT